MALINKIWFGSISVSALQRWLLFGAIGALAVGCGGSGSGGDNPDTTKKTSLSEEEQALGAAVLGVTLTSMVQQQAENSAEPPENQTGSTAGLGYSSAQTAATSDDVPLNFECTQGTVRSDFGDLIDLASVSFPAASFQNIGSLAFTSGSADDMQMRVNECIISDDGGVELLRMDGSADVGQLVGINDSGARAVYAVAGAYAGDGRADVPDTDGYLESSVSFGAHEMDMRARYKFWLCEGCVDGDMGNFTGTSLDVTSVSFIDMRFSYSDDSDIEIYTGKFGGDPFVFSSSDAGGGNAEVDLGGRMAYTDHNTGCGFDVTYATERTLFLSGYDTESSSTDDGEIRVTLNETGSTYTVAFSNGDATVWDAVGNVVTPEPSERAIECGFVDGGGVDDEGNTETGSDDPSGTWRSQCKQMGVDTWGQLTLTFEGAISQSVEQAYVYDNDTCSGMWQDGSATSSWHYTVGNAVSTEPGAYEIDFINLNDQREVFDIFKIDGNTLYLGAPDSGPDQAAYRPTVIDTSWAFAKQ